MTGLWTLFLLVGSVRVWISPNTLTLAPGEHRSFQVQVEQDGTPVSPDTLWFEVLPPRLGYVEGHTFFAREPGVGVLRAVARVGQREAVGHAALQIAPHAARLRVEINPRRVTLEPGGSVPFQIRVLAPDGTEVPGAQVQVRVVPPWLGTWSNGTFRADEVPGQGMLVVTARGPQGKTGVARARIEVQGRFRPKPLRLRVEPSVLELQPGERREIQVEVPGRRNQNLEVFLYPVPENLGRVQDGRVFIAGPDTLRGVLWVAVKTPDGHTGIRRIPVAVGRPLPHPRIQPERIHARPGERLHVRLQVPRERRAPGKRRWLRQLRWTVVPPDLARVRGQGLRADLQLKRPGVGLLVVRAGRRPVAAAPILGKPEVALTATTTRPKVGETFEVKVPDSTTWRFQALPPGRVEMLAPGRFRALKPGPVWILAEGPEACGALRIEILP